MEKWTRFGVLLGANNRVFERALIGVARPVCDVAAPTKPMLHTHGWLISEARGGTGANGVGPSHL
jgi:hypothetical protein